MNSSILRRYAGPSRVFPGCQREYFSSSFLATSIKLFLEDEENSLTL
jgi:hypothetical protein